ncbi:MAG: hypothetical protein LBJ24_06515 [Treponema sp.]|jgi:hypothetical protein|nr:hypothetical protein [Treponema sp.]
MKKYYLVIFGLVCTTLIVGCTSSSTLADAAAGNPNGSPDWYWNTPDDEDAVYGVGEAKVADGNMARSLAEARARTSLARILSSEVQAMIRDYTRTAGSGDNVANYIP